MGLVCRKLLCSEGIHLGDFFNRLFFHLVPLFSFYNRFRIRVKVGLTRRSHKSRDRLKKRPPTKPKKFVRRNPKSLDDLYLLVIKTSIKLQDICAV